MIELKQTWWYIEDKIKPTDTRIIRQVMDIFTNQQFLEIPVEGIDFEELEIRCRNLDRELPYIEGDGEIIVSLGDLDEFPTAPGQNLDMRHVRLEIGYVLIDQNFKKSWGDFSYIGGLQIDEFIQPEFYIRVPPGMEIKEKSESFKIFFYQNCENGEGTEELKIEGPYIDRENGKDRYNYFIDYEEYLRLKEKVKRLKDCRVGFRIIYRVSIDWRLFIFPILGLIFLALSIARISQLVTSGVGNPAYYLRVLVLLISYAGFVYKFHTEGYNIPLLKVTYLSIASLILLVLFEILFS